MTMARFGLAGRDVHVQDAHECVLEGDAVRVGRDPYRIEGVAGCLAVRERGSDTDKERDAC
jgi:hypothetical protein